MNDLRKKLNTIFKLFFHHIINLISNENITKLFIQK